MPAWVFIGFAEHFGESASVHFYTHITAPGPVGPAHDDPAHFQAGETLLLPLLPLADPAFHRPVPPLPPPFLPALPELSQRACAPVEARTIHKSLTFLPPTLVKNVAQTRQETRPAQVRPRPFPGPRPPPPSTPWAVPRPPTAASECEVF